MKTLKYALSQYNILFFSIILSIFLIGCETIKDEAISELKIPEPKNWAEKLGYPEGKKIIMLHADDIGMSEEANIAADEIMLNNHIQSAAIMMPCPNAEAFVQWAIDHPGMDVGLHLTLTSEWQNYRWGPVSDPNDVPSLIDPDGKLWHEVHAVVAHATVEDIEKEIRAQIEKSIALGHRPDHIDTHMGTLYGHPSFVKVFFKVAEEYGIPANVIDLSNPEVIDIFKARGFPIDESVIKLVESYTLPKLDFFTSAPKGNTYEEKIENFKKLIKSLKPGITEIIFHPSVDTENLKSITNSWQQRVWEYEMFSDPDLIQFFEAEGIIFTDWKEMMNRFKKM
ncbi:MAG: polysaccharide deacetylase family protein [Flavobacteriaceae bacterium]|nr:polysaccharide deacetylase family protein [Flavobacteriaceae bacterium]